jgi:GPH family glycoside/pentoside/hexuronide:cation symporter
MGLAMGALLAVAMLATYAGTGRAPMAERHRAEPTLRAQLAVLRTNRRFGWLLGLSCAQMLAAGLMLAGAPYFATYTLRDPHAVTPLFVCLVGPILVTMPPWIHISRRIEKRGAMILASLLFMAGSAGLVATPTLGSAYAYACVLVIGVGYAGLQLLQYSMLADTIVADAQDSGKRRAGVFTGVWTAAETVVFAFGALVLAALLAAAGFVSSDLEHPVEQSQSALNAVQWGAPMIAVAVMALAIAATTRYDLTPAALNTDHAPGANELQEQPRP